MFGPDCDTESPLPDGVPVSAPPQPDLPPFLPLSGSYDSPGRLNEAFQRPDAAVLLLLAQEDNIVRSVALSVRC